MFVKMLIARQIKGYIVVHVGKSENNVHIPLCGFLQRPLKTICCLISIIPNDVTKDHRIGYY